VVAQAISVLQTCRLFFVEMLYLRYFTHEGNFIFIIRLALFWLEGKWWCWENVKFFCAGSMACSELDFLEVGLIEIGIFSKLNANSGIGTMPGIDDGIGIKGEDFFPYTAD